MKKNGIFAALLVMILVAGCSNSANSNEHGTGTGDSVISVSTANQLRDEFNAGSKTIKLAAGDYVIPKNFLYVVSSRSITLFPPDSGTATIYAAADTTTNIFSVGKNGTLIIGKEGSAGKIVLDGSKKEKDHDNFNGADGALLVAFGDGAKIIIYDGVSLIKNTWHAVQIGSGSTFEMKGGLIDGNRCAEGGAGVDVTAGGIFVMEGGTIANNNAWRSTASGGGVYVGGNDGARARFTMKGGVIRGNTTGYRGGGVYINSLGDFRMEGGKIHGYNATDGDSNSAGASHTSGAAIYREDGSTAETGDGTPFQQSTNTTVEI